MTRVKFAWETAPVVDYFEEYEEKSFGFIAGESGKEPRFRYRDAARPYVTGYGKHTKIRYVLHASVPYPKPGDILRYQAREIDRRLRVMIWMYDHEYREVLKEYRRRRKMSDSEPFE